MFVCVLISLTVAVWFTGTRCNVRYQAQGLVSIEAKKLSFPLLVYYISFLYKTIIKSTK